MHIKNFLVLLVLLPSANLLHSQCTNCTNLPTGTNASSLGFNNNATGNASFVSGAQSTSSGDGSTSLGAFNNALGDYSVTIGNYLEASDGTSNTIVIGTGNFLSYKLTNNISNSLMIGFNSNLPTLFVSPSTLGHGYTGKVGIGNVTDPEAKLHIKADQGESASFLLEPNSWGSASYADIYIGNTNHGIRADQRYGLIFKTEDDFIFSQGKVGIGTDEPATKIHVKSGDIYIEDIDRGIIMKSPDGNCWRGTIDNNGQLNFTLLNECPEENITDIEEPEQEESVIKIYPNPVENYIKIEIRSNLFKQLRFELINEQGSIITSADLNKTITIINTLNIAPGVYYVKIIGDEIYKVEKIIKLK